MKKVTLGGRYGAGQFALVDDADYERVTKHRWHLTVGGYVASGPNVYMHRLVLKASKGQGIDHVNGDPRDNRRRNLRLCNQSQNAANRGVSKANTSGFKGVSKKGNGWKAQIRFRYKDFYLGTFRSKKGAALAYREASRSLFGSFSRTV
jgi:hypothetical protein